MAFLTISDHIRPVFQSHTCGPAFSSFLCPKTQTVCFSSGTQIAGLEGLFVFVFGLTFSYFQDVSFREENGSVLSTSLIERSSDGALLCGQRSWNLGQSQQRPEAGSLGPRTSPFQNKKMMVFF